MVKLHNMISFLIPAFNEEESLDHFYEELTKVIPSLTDEYEILFVDDGSTDSTLEILKSFAEKDKHVKIFSFRRNLGKAEALSFGFFKAKGDYIITLDADLQDKPSEIHKLITKATEGVEVVAGWRKDRKDKSKMKIISKIFNFIVGYLFDLHLHDYNCGLKLLTKDAAKSLRLYGGLHRFIPLLTYEQGFIVDEIAIQHEPRKYGKSKFGFSKLWKDLPDMFTMLFLVKYSKRPMHFFGFIGGLSLFIGVSILIYLTFLHYELGATVGRRPLLFMGVLFVISGFQIFFTGFLADLMINIAHSPRLVGEEGSRYPMKYSSEGIKKLQ
jgi:glycosyltransferase involved in cell wall biosynthesis